MEEGQHAQYPVLGVMIGIDRVHLSCVGREVLVRQLGPFGVPVVPPVY